MKISFRLKGFLIALFLVCYFGSIGQDQQLADSLVKVLDKTRKRDTSRLLLLRQIARNQSEPQQKLRYSDLLIEEAKKENNLKYLHHAYLNQGQAYRQMGDFDVASYALFKALDYAQKSNYQKGIAASNMALAEVYSLLEDHNNSAVYYKRALEELKESDRLLRAGILMNLGDEYYMSKTYDSALVSFKESNAIFQKVGNNPSGLAYSLGNMGLIMAELGRLSEAESRVREAISQFESIGDHYGSAIFLSYMAEIYKKRGLLYGATAFADSSMAIARRHNLKTEIRDNSLRLADIYAMNNDFEEAFKFHRDYVRFKDSIAKDEVYGRIENLESAFALARKQGEVELLKERERNQQIILFTTIVIVIILLVLASVIYSYYRSKIRVNRILEEQKRALQELNETKDKLFSIISHDLRGPVSSFQGISRMIKQLVVKKETERLLVIADDIDQSVSRLSSLLDNLLNWAMQQQGNFPNIPERIDLNEAMTETVEMMSMMATSKQINLTIDSEDELRIWADRNLTMTILRNLVNNAIKFTPEGGEVRLSAQRVENLVQINIADTGVGIPNGQLENLFHLDSKSSYGTSGEKGLGLGLQLVQEFVEMAKGSISVSSEEKRGTTFTVTLPLFETGEVPVT